MIFFSNAEIESWINEDAPMLDLTSHLLGIGAQPAALTVRAPFRLRGFDRGGWASFLSCSVPGCPCWRPVACAWNGVMPCSPCAGGQMLHRGWKVAMNLLEHACGVATRTAEMVDEQGSCCRQHPFIDYPQASAGGQRKS